MSTDKPHAGSGPDRNHARRERQARELRENLVRRKEQSRARAAREHKPPDQARDDENGS